MRRVSFFFYFWFFPCCYPFATAWRSEGPGLLGELGGREKGKEEGQVFSVELYWIFLLCCAVYCIGLWFVLYSSPAVTLVVGGGGLSDFFFDFFFTKK